MTIKVCRFGNEVWMYDFDKGSCGHLVDTEDGVTYDGDPDLLKLYNGTRRGLLDDDRLSALYSSLESNPKSKD